MVKGPTNSSGIWKEKDEKFGDKEAGLNMWIMYEMDICEWV